eukprot:scaffold7419_cov210-Pinguiococcus_pyrenoidosus.AAC.3
MWQSGARVTSVSVDSSLSRLDEELLNPRALAEVSPSVGLLSSAAWALKLFRPISARILLKRPSLVSPKPSVAPCADLAGVSSMASGLGLISGCSARATTLPFESLTTSISLHARDVSRLRELRRLLRSALGSSRSTLSKIASCTRLLRIPAWWASLSSSAAMI